jgi:hypothetical protein
VKVVAVPPDGERLAVDLLEAELAARGQDVTVGVNLPPTWTRKTKAHVQVAMDGTPTGNYPVLFNTVIRVTVWASSSTLAKALAALCQGVLLAHGGQPGWDGCRFGTGVLPATDPGTKADLASVTVIAKLRGQAVA